MMMMMVKVKKKGLLALTLLLFIIFVALSFPKSSLAVPSTRSLMMIHPAGNPSSPSVALQHGFPDQGATMIKLSDDDEEGDVIEGRMELERLDYPGTGANNHHDPKTPGNGRP